MRMHQRDNIPVSLIAGIRTRCVDAHSLQKLQPRSASSDACTLASALALPAVKCSLLRQGYHISNTIYPRYNNYHCADLLRHPQVR